MLTESAYLASLAGSLINQGISLSQLGRPSEALPPTTEAVQIYRQLAAKDPAFQEGLDRALNRLNLIRRQLGRPEEALPSTEPSLSLQGSGLLPSRRRHPIGVEEWRSLGS